MADPSIQVGADSQLATTVFEMLGKVPPLPKECCIFKVPECLRSVNEEAFTPIVISIGPLHHEEKKLQPFEAHKKRYLSSFLQRNSNISLEDCVKLLRGCEERARNFYFEDQFSWCYSSDEFVRMMLLDGCFIIEFFLEEENEYDPVKKSHSLWNSVARDILLLENQLPYFVLNNLYNLVNGPEKRCSRVSFHQITLHRLNYLLIMGQPDHFIRSSCDDIKHLLDILRVFFVPSTTRILTKETAKVRRIPSATTLHESGVKFNMGTTNCFLDITFTKGVINIPTMIVEDRTELVFRNLIAMEQSQEDTTTFIGDYFYILDSLVNTANDVAFLQSNGIIENYLGSNEEVAQMINNIENGVVARIDRNYYGALMQDLNDYYSRPWHQWKAKLRRDYFNNPWTIISLCAAFFLLVCTLIQTVCLVISVRR
ncbi:hypothetical protein IFM89_016032 [Coptis chinensis]|uniref:Uncharacterized protein n=1 Tax=Coptis chinensis TaxID=261450 RepID=A0A835H4M9_9MAGN|nr:hypothetical protein IFM89_016032 [Coptis chinensis]